MTEETEVPRDPKEPMSKEDRSIFGAQLRMALNSRRDTFVIDKFMFEPYEINAHGHLSADTGVRQIEMVPARTTEWAHGQQTAKLRAEQKTVSAAAMKLLLDYCEGNWPMDFVSYCAGIFHGREPNPGETAFDLMPDVRQRVSADRLGLGHIYGNKGPA